MCVAKEAYMMDMSNKKTTRRPLAEGREGYFLAFFSVLAGFSSSFPATSFSGAG